MRSETGPAIELEKGEGSMGATILKACIVCNVRNMHYEIQISRMELYVHKIKQGFSFIIVILLCDTNAPPSCAGGRRGKVEGTGVRPGGSHPMWPNPTAAAASTGWLGMDVLMGWRTNVGHCYCVRLGRVQII